MNKKKMLAVWGSLIIVFLIMIFIEMQPQTVQAVNEQDDEVIYLGALAHEPLIESIPLSEPIALPVLPEATIAPPEVGRLGVTSVIINKKSATITPAQSMPADINVQSMQDPNLEFLQASAKGQVEMETAQQHVNLAYKIFQGQRFSAVLTHAINSDLPGMVVAEISQDTYGYHSREPLLPKGTRLIGAYNSRLQVGDQRLYIVWQRAITPLGVDIALGSPGSDRLGQAGLSGFVDSHFWQTFGTSSLLSVMAIGASNMSEAQGEDSNQYQQGVTDSLMDTSRMILRGRIQRKPTIHIPQGEIIHVMAAKDLDFHAVQNKTQDIIRF